MPAGNIRLVVLAALFLCLIVALPLWLSHPPPHPGKPGTRTDINNAPHTKLRLAAEAQTNAENTRTPQADTPIPPAVTANGRQQPMPDRYIVSVPDERSWDAVLAWAAANDVAVHGSSRRLGAISLQPATPGLLQSLRAALPGVVIESNAWVFAPDLPERAPQPLADSGIAFRNQALEWLGISSEVYARGKGVSIAVLDTVVQDHPALQGVPITRLQAADPPFPDVDGAYRGHGTAVASLLVGDANSQIPGIVPEATLIAVEVLDANGVGNAFDLARGILLALDAGASVINMSLGTHTDSTVVRQAVDLALAEGVLVVAAAGNEARDTPTFPAAYPGVVAVSAVDARGEHAAYANTGDSIDIAAPGVGLYAAWTDNTLVSFSGTSAAAPFVTGTLAMLLGDPEKPAPDLALQQVLAHADDNGAPGADAYYGQGTLNVGRILQRNEPDIVDAALSSHYLDAADDSGGLPSLLVNAQNRGTIPIESLEIVISANQTTTIHTFTAVPVGDTVSVAVQLDPAILQDGQELWLDTHVQVPGVPLDAVPQNDARRSRVFLTAHTPDQP